MVRLWVHGTVVGWFDMSPYEAKLLGFTILAHGNYDREVKENGEHYYYVEYEGVKYPRPNVTKENITFADVRVYSGAFRVL